jgi:hypothetical protein
MKFTFTGWALLVAVALSLVAATVGVTKKVSDYPSVTTPGTNDFFLLAITNAPATNHNIKYSALKAAINATNQPASLNLSNWSALATSAKQDALGYTPQPASTNLTNWSALATSAKQDALGYTPQPASTNLTNWSALATSAKQDALGYTPQPASLNLTNWSQISTSAIPTIASVSNKIADSGGHGTNTTLMTPYLASPTSSSAVSTNPTFVGTISAAAADFSGAVTAPTGVFTNYIQFPWTTLTMSGSNVSTINLSAGSMFKLTLTNNAFIGAPSGLPGTNQGQIIQVHLAQDGTGGRTLMLTNSGWVLSGSGTSTNAIPSVSTNANAVSVLTFSTSPFSATLLYGVLATTP